MPASSTLHPWPSGQPEPDSLQSHLLHAEVTFVMRELIFLNLGIEYSIPNRAQLTK